MLGSLADESALLTALRGLLAGGRYLEAAQRLEALPAPEGGSLLDQTTVLVMSEMGRTPIHNAAIGKDHWPVTSAMLVGAGVAGGRVVGATDDELESLIRAAVWGKWSGHRINHADFVQPARSMSAIGG